MSENKVLNDRNTDETNQEERDKGSKRNINRQY